MFSALFFFLFCFLVTISVFTRFPFSPPHSARKCWLAPASSRMASLSYCRHFFSIINILIIVIIIIIVIVKCIWRKQKILCIILLLFYYRSVTARSGTETWRNQQLNYLWIHTHTQTHTPQKHHSRPSSSSSLTLCLTHKHTHKHTQMCTHTLARTHWEGWRVGGLGLRCFFSVQWSEDELVFVALCCSRVAVSRSHYLYSVPKQCSATVGLVPLLSFQ